MVFEGGIVSTHPCAMQNNCFSHSNVDTLVFYVYGNFVD
jgi:hypothetical protein